jgi:hypothetical protein
VARASRLVERRFSNEVSRRFLQTVLGRADAAVPPWGPGSNPGLDPDRILASTLIVINSLKPKRERRESEWVVRDTTFNKGEAYGYEGPQVVPARPSGKGGF